MYKMQVFNLVVVLLSYAPIFASAAFPIQTYHSTNVTNPQLKIEKSGQPLAPGYLIFATAQKGGNPAYIMTDDGELIWAGPNLADGSDFRIQMLHNQRVITEFTGQNSPYGYHYGKVDIIDSSYRVIQTVCPQLGLYIPNFPTLHGKTPKCQADAHENEISAGGTMMITAYNVTRTDLSAVKGPKNGWVIDSQFYEIELNTGDILFKWSSLEHVPINQTHVHVYGGAGNTDMFPFDYFHINAIQKLPDGRFFACARNTGAVYYIDTDGSVLWTFEGTTGGDFTLPKTLGASFNYQHDAKIVHRHGTVFTIYMFNDDNSGSKDLKHPSTGLKFQLDTSDMSSTLLERYNDPNDILEAWKEGSYQPLSNGDVLIGYGSVCVIKEFSGNNGSDVKMTVQFGDHDASYRSYREVWHGQPSSPPSVAVSQSAGIGWVSWNGATAVQRYVLFAGQNKTSLKQAGNVPKSGFETSFTLPSSIQSGGYLQVVAHGNNTALGSSAIVQV